MGNELPKLAARVSCTELTFAAGRAPLSREASAAVALSDTELLLFGGGSGGDEEGGALQFEDAWLLTLPGDVSTATWRQIETHGERPCARTGHAMVCTTGAGGSRAVIVIGGCSAASGFLSGAHMLDVATWTWSPCVAGDLAPSPRDKLTAVAFGTRVLVFGGFGPTSEGEDSGEVDEEASEQEEGEAEAGVSFARFNDMHILSHEGDAWSWSAPVTHGDAPSARAAHAATAIGNKMLIFGGRDAGGRTGDTYTLDAATLTWERVGAEAPAPTARSFHALASLHPSPGAVCFGGLNKDDALIDGVDVLDLRDAAAWAQPQERAGSWPPPRTAAAVTMLGSRLVVVEAASADGQPCSCRVLDCADVQRVLSAPKTS